MTDFTIYAGEDWPQQYIYNDANGDGIDLTDIEIDLVATTGGISPDTITKGTGDASITIEDQNSDPGLFTVLIEPADTTGLGGKIFNYEIKITDAGEERVIYPLPNAEATFDILWSLTDTP